MNDPERITCPEPRWYDAMWAALEEGPQEQPEELAGRPEDEPEDEEDESL